MLPTFVIGLREGLEAALIVGIIAAFLRRQGRTDLVRWVFAGVGIAAVLCLGVGVTLKVVSQDLPQRQQEGMETVVGALAVVMVTYMVVWMRRHSADLKGQLEGLASSAIGGTSGSGRALVVMAFLAVLREGIETAVFLLATFNESKAGASAPIGVILGLALAVALGYGIYRGGVRLDVSRFFRATGLVLVLVAAGLVVTALHTAHEAGWLDAGQGATIDLSWLARPGSVQSSLLSGILGVQPRPVTIEVVGWLLYLIPVALYVAWPSVGRSARPARTRLLLVSTASLVAVAGVLALVLPTGPAVEPPSRVSAGSVATTDARVATVTITAAKGCEVDASTFAAGGLTFSITNEDATAVSEVELLSGERIVGEKENVAPGLTGEFAVRVTAGTYTLYCPGAATERTPITVTGSATSGDQSVTTLLAAGTAEYKGYVDTQVGYLLTSTRQLDTALHGTDLAAAQHAYIEARPYYEKIEPVAESFVNGTDNLDADIDARANDVPPAQFEGFHRIEQGLFQRRSLSGLSTFGDKLVADVAELQTKTASLTYQAPDLANGAQELLDEVASTKITGEEERYSHIDILDMASNVEGSQQAFADLEPALTRIDAGLAAAISSAFSSLGTAIDTYRTTSTASGYVLYGALDDTDRRALAAAVKAVQEPLSRVASKVANA